MIKLLKKCGILAAICLGIGASLIGLSTIPSCTSVINMMTDSVSYQGLGKDEVLDLLQKVNEPNGTTRLILGDSVANQLYLYRGNDEYYIATGNLAMTFVWQYIFAKDYLEAHPEATDIYLCITPDSLERSFEVKLSYNYLLIPLAQTNNMDALDEEQYSLLKDMYGSFFVKPETVRFIGASGLNTKLYLNAVENFYTLFPQRRSRVEKTSAPDLNLAETYILNIQTLCDEHDVTLHLIPNPKMDTEENREYLKQLEDEYRHSPLYQINPGFFEQIIFYPEEVFKDDLHFKDEFLEDEGKFEVIKAVQEATGELEGLIQ